MAELGNLPHSDGSNRCSDPGRSARTDDMTRGSLEVHPDPRILEPTARFELATGGLRS